MSAKVRRIRSALLALCVCGAMPWCVGAVPERNEGTHPPSLTAEQIIDRNVQARGGLEAWRGIATMTVAGQLTNDAQESAAFIVRMKRPGKRRMDVNLRGDGLAAQIFDGQAGWDVRRYRGHPKVQPFSGAELSRATLHEDLDSPLIDYVSKGNQVQLEARERVDGRDAYRLKLVQAGQYTRRVWIDAQSFLEIEIEEFPRISRDRIEQVATHFADFRKVQGVVVPFSIETRTDDGEVIEHSVLERVMLNPKIEDSVFRKPQAGAHLMNGF